MYANIVVCRQDTVNHFYLAVDNFKLEVLCVNTFPPIDFQLSSKDVKCILYYFDFRFQYPMPNDSNNHVSWFGAENWNWVVSQNFCDWKISVR